VTAEDVTKLESTLAEHGKLLAQISERQESFLRELLDHKKTLYGNGTPGLKVDVQHVCDLLKSMPIGTDMATMLTEHNERKHELCRVPSRAERITDAVLANAFSSLVVGVAVWLLIVYTKVH
jgi:hypothetical protein